MGLGPLESAGLALHLEVLVAFGAAEAEDARVVADEGDAFGGVDGPRTEVACFDSGILRLDVANRAATIVRDVVPHDCAAGANKALDLSGGLLIV